MRWRTWLGLPVGVLGAIAGLLPWLVHGMRLPLQNLWATPVTEATSPVVLLPFSQYAVATIAAVLVVGGALAGLPARAVPGERRWRDRVLLVVGVLLVHAVAIAQTATVVGAGLQPRRESTLYLALLVAGSVFSTAVGVVVLLLVSARHRAAVVVGVALAAPLVAPWVAGLIAGPATLFDGPSWLLSVPRWLAPIGVGVAIAWSGLRTPGRVAAAVLALLSLWIGPALITAFSGAVGIRVYASDPAAMLGYASQVLGLALTAPDLVLPPLLIAVVVAVVGLLLRGARSRRTTAAHP